MSLMKKIFSLIFLSLLLAGCQKNSFESLNYQNTKPANTMTQPTATVTAAATPSVTTTPAKLSENITAVFKTSMGDIEIQLFPKSAPLTVENFVGLAKGTKSWTDPKTGKSIADKSLYSGTIFHRVIKEFMIQGGDPMGTGMGGPGYRFADEFDPSLNFSEPYMLAMANSGPSTNGSQFFITVVPTTWLNNKHTIFGKVTKGKEVVDAIANTDTLPGDKPVKDVVLKSVEIVEK